MTFLITLKKYSRKDFFNFWNRVEFSGRSGHINPVTSVRSVVVTSLAFWRFQRINKISSESDTINKWAFENDGEGDLAVGIESALDFFKQPHLQAVEQERDELGFEPTRQSSISSANMTIIKFRNRAAFPTQSDFYLCFLTVRR